MLSILLNKLTQKRLSSEMAWVLVGNSLNIFCLFISLKLLTTILGALNFGEYALGLAIVGIIHIFVYGPITQATLRFYSKIKFEDKLNTLLYFLFNLHKKVIVILLSFGFISAILVMEIVDNKWGLITIITTLIAILNGITATITAIFTADRNRMAVAIFQGCSAFLNLPFSLAAIYLISVEGSSALLGYTISTLLSTLLYCLYFLKKYNFSKSDNIQKLEYTFEQPFFTFARPFFIFALLGCTVNYGDRWIVQILFNQEMTGIYTVLFQISNTPLSFFCAILNQYLSPIFYRAHPQNHILEKHRLLFNLALIGSGGCLLIWCLIVFYFSKIIISILTSNDFIVYHDSLWLMTFGCAIFHFAQLISIRGFIELRPHSYITAKTIHAVSFFIFIFLWRDLSIYGISFAIIMSSFCYLLAIAFANRNNHEH